MKKRLMLSVYSISHFFVDFCCAYIMFNLVKPQGDWLSAMLLYNFCAFALQMPLGIIADRFNKSYIFALFGCVFICVGVILNIGMLCPVIIGVGNALFHIGAGEDVMTNFETCTPLGIFVSPGAIGLYLGTVFHSTTDPRLLCTVIMIFCAGTICVFCRNTDHMKEEYIEEPKTGASKIIAAICLFIVVVIRSFAGMSFSFPWKTGVLALCVVAAVVLGKMLGGVCYDMIGGRLTTVISLSLSAVCLLFSNHPALGIAGVLLFNFTMPITLYELAKRFPDKKGFAFGMLTFALFVGFLPVLFGSGSINGVVSAILSLVSLALLIPFTGGNKNGA